MAYCVDRAVNSLHIGPWPVAAEPGWSASGGGCGLACSWTIAARGRAHNDGFLCLAEVTPVSVLSAARATSLKRLENLTKPPASRPPEPGLLSISPVRVAEVQFRRLSSRLGIQWRRAWLLGATLFFEARPNALGPAIRTGDPGRRAGIHPAVEHFVALAKFLPFVLLKPAPCRHGDELLGN